MRLPAILLAACIAMPALAKDNFVLEDEVQLCKSCHGEDGIPIEPDYPIIFGQQYFYIYTQLRDYGAGRRQNETMTGVAAEYSRGQAKELATYFSKLDWPEIEVSTEEGDVTIAELGITGGQCSACHGKWEGDSRIPRLAGQNPEYLRKTMLDFRDEVRMNAPDKISTMQHLDEQTIDALARYLASLKIED